MSGESLPWPIIALHKAVVNKLLKKCGLLLLKVFRYQSSLIIIWLLIASLLDATTDDKKKIVKKLVVTFFIKTVLLSSTLYAYNLISKFGRISYTNLWMIKNELKNKKHNSKMQITLKFEEPLNILYAIPSSIKK